MDSGCECVHGVPGVVDVEDRIIVVLEVISVNRDVSGADETGPPVGEFYRADRNEILAGLVLVQTRNIPWYTSAYRGSGFPLFSTLLSS